MADFLDEKRSEIGERIKELKPGYDEYRRLVAAAAALDGVPKAKTTSPRPTRTRAAKAPAKRRSSSNGTARRGRPKGSGTRGAEALALVKDQPGITIPEMAAKMGIKQNYLYRVLPGLAEDGLVRKAGVGERLRGWYPKEAA